jgi:glucose-6-phosphate isomerase
VTPHRVMPGNRAITALLAKKLTRLYWARARRSTSTACLPRALLGIDASGQRGVDRGTVLAVQSIAELESAAGPEPAHDSSTNALIRC